MTADRILNFKSMTLSIAALLAALGSTPSELYANGQTSQTFGSVTQEEIAVDYFVIDQSIEGFLQMLSSDANIRFDMTEGVLGRVKRQRISGTPQEVIDQLSARHELDWFLFNGIYYISSREEALTRLVRLGSLGEARAIGALSGAGLSQQGFPTRITADGSALALSGPPKYLGLAEAVLESVPDVQVIAKPEKIIRIRRGVHISDVSATEVTEQAVQVSQN